MKKGISIFLPIILGIVVIIAIYFIADDNPAFVDYISIEKDLDNIQNKTVDIVLQLNNFLITLITLMFGALGFYLTKYSKSFEGHGILILYILSLILLGVAYYYAFMVYSQLTSEFAQNVYGMKPGESKVLYYLARTFWASFGSSLMLLCIFIFGIVLNKNEQKISTEK